MSLASRRIGSVLTALLLLGSGSAEPYLVVSDEEGNILLELPLGDEPAWTVAWNHSVTGNLVQDHYLFEGGRMLLVASRAPTFDAGLGHVIGRGRLESDGEGGHLIVGIDEPVTGNSYLLRVGGPKVDHRIVHAGASHSLSAMAAGRRLRIGIRE